MCDKGLVSVPPMNKEWVESYWDFYMPQLTLKVWHLLSKYFTMNHSGKSIPIANTLSCVPKCLNYAKTLVNKYMKVDEWEYPHPFIHTLLMPTNQASV